MKKIILLFLGMIPLLLWAQGEKGIFGDAKITIEEANINTTHSDYGPSFVEEELWFSAYTQEEIKKLTDGKEKNIFYDLFSSDLDKKGNTNGEKKIEFNDLGKGYHIGPVSYCNKTGELFVTVSNHENPDVHNVVFKKADIQLKIIVAKMEGGKWVVKEDLPYNDSTYSVGHPAVSVTGDTLFFASNVPGKGQGNTDIYMATRKNGKWGQMENLGNKINTRGQEMFPSLFRNNILFFASDGLKGAGKLDIFYTSIKDGEFQKPERLELLNSDSDDFGLVFHANEKVGYFTSDRTGGKGHDDIYKVILEHVYNLEVRVLDKETMKAIPKATVSFDDGVEAKKARSVFARTLEEDQTVVATAKAEGYMFATKTISTVGKSGGTIEETILLEKIEEKKIYVINNIYYDFDKWNILPESEVELDKLVEVLNENPDLKVELGSHTDCRGSDRYNEILSQKRSDSAVGYIVSKGIDKRRILAKGYGEYKLINKCEDGVPCTEDEHRKNRRTEIKVLDND